MDGAAEPPAVTALSITPSSLRAWFYLVWLGVQRQARARQMVLMALGLLVLAAGGVAVITARHEWAPPWLTVRGTAASVVGLVASPGAPGPISAAALLVSPALADGAAFMRFSEAVVFDVLLGFLMPLWSLSFATQALGGEREERSLIWLLSRPLPRPAIYLAKYVSLLPWCLALNLGGFWVLCLAGGSQTRVAFALYWPAVFMGTVAYAALFHLMAALSRRPAVVAIVYTFFVETFVGSMPGAMKRISISFFDRCMVIAAAERYHVEPPAVPEIYMPVQGPTALAILVLGTLVLLAVGAAVFARTEYADMS